MSNENWFSEGYEQVQEVAQQIEDRMNQVFIPPFIIKNEDEVRVTFLTDKPITYFEHFVKGVNRSFTCSQTADCPLCAMGNKPSFRGAYLVVDHRVDRWIDSQTKEEKTQQYAVKVAKFGIRALQVLERKNKKKGLMKSDWMVTRTGSGNDTQYDFEDEEKAAIPMPEAEKIPDLREFLKPKDSKYIIQKVAQGGAGRPAGPLQVNSSKDDENEVISFKGRN
jgi:hypothetical protein